MPTISVKDSGTWKEAKEILVKDAGTWKAVKEVHVKDAGVWKKAFPETGTQTYSTAGTYSFVVPNGIYSLTMPLLVAGGGGGGGSVFAGDGHGAANGGAGGFYSSQTIVVTPGETLTVVVGAGGVGVATGAGTQGGRGGTTSISRSATMLFEATGGYGGNGVTGDNVPNNTSPANGSAGGSPSGVAGSYQAAWMVNRNDNRQGLDGKGENGTTYGTGGLGESAFGIASTNGGTGYVSLSW